MQIEIVKRLKEANFKDKEISEITGINLSELKDLD